jgi:hypothetical protein
MRKVFSAFIGAMALLALANCGLNVSAAVTDANAVVADIQGLSTTLLNSVPAGKSQLIASSIANLKADVDAKASPAQLVVDVTELATVVGTSVPDFQAAIVSDEAVVSAGFKQLQTDMTKLKADLGLAAKQPLASLRAQAAAKAH